MKAAAPLNAVDKIEIDEGRRMIWRFCGAQEIYTLLAETPTSVLESIGLLQTLQWNYSAPEKRAVIDFALGFQKEKSCSFFRGQSLEFSEDVIRAAFFLPKGGSDPTMKPLLDNEIEQLFARNPRNKNLYTLHHCTQKGCVGIMRVVNEQLLGRHIPTQVTKNPMWYFWCYLTDKVNPRPRLDWASLIEIELGNEVLHLQKHLLSIGKKTIPKRVACNVGTAIMRILEYHGVVSINSSTKFSFNGVKYTGPQLLPFPPGQSSSPDMRVSHEKGQETMATIVSENAADAASLQRERPGKRRNVSHLLPCCRQTRRTMQIPNETHEAHALQATEAPGEAEDLQSEEAPKEGSESQHSQGPQGSKGADEAHALQATEAPGAQAQISTLEKITWAVQAGLKALERYPLQAQADKENAETELATSMKERDDALAAAQEVQNNCDAFQLKVEQLQKVIELQDLDLDSATRRCDDATNEAEELRVQMKEQKERFESDREVTETNARNERLECDLLKRERDQLKEDNALLLQIVESTKRDRDEAKHLAAELGDVIKFRSQLEAVEKKICEQLQLQTKEAQQALDTYRRREQLNESTMTDTPTMSKDTLDKVARLKSELNDTYRQREQLNESTIKDTLEEGARLGSELNDHFFLARGRIRSAVRQLEEADLENCTSSWNRALLPKREGKGNAVL